MVGSFLSSPPSISCIHHQQKQGCECDCDTHQQLLGQLLWDPLEILTLLQGPGVLRGPPPLISMPRPSRTLPHRQRHATVICQPLHQAHGRVHQSISLGLVMEEKHGSLLWWQHTFTHYFVPSAYATMFHIWLTSQTLWGQKRGLAWF